MPSSIAADDPILTIDAPAVHNAVYHPTSPHIRPGEKRFRGLRTGTHRVAATSK